MKLLYLHTRAIGGGRASALQVLHMCRAFCLNGAEVVLAVPGRADDTERVRREIAEQMGGEPPFKVRLYHRPTLGGRLAMIGGYRSVRKILVEEPADCCLTRNPVYLNAALGHGIPTVFESHDAVVHANFLWNLLWTRNLIRNSRREPLVRFVCISCALAETWRARGVPRHKVMILHDGVDTDAYRRLPEPDAARRRLGLPDDRKIVLYSGSLYVNREIERVLELAVIFTDAHFVIIGGPREQADFFRGLIERKNIRNLSVVGPVPHRAVPEYLAAADVLLMIWSRKVRTINICSPLKMFEYMAAGRIIVGDGYPTIREVLTDGKNAFLARPDAFESLREKLAAALLRSYPDDMAGEARKLAMSEYSWKQRARRILDALPAGGGAARPAEEMPA